MLQAHKCCKHTQAHSRLQKGNKKQADPSFDNTNNCFLPYKSVCWHILTQHLQIKLSISTAWTPLEHKPILPLEHKPILPQFPSIWWKLSVYTLDQTQVENKKPFQNCLSIPYLELLPPKNVPFCIFETLGINQSTTYMYKNLTTRVCTRVLWFQIVKVICSGRSFLQTKQTSSKPPVQKPLRRHPAAWFEIQKKTRLAQNTRLAHSLCTKKLTKGLDLLLMWEQNKMICCHERHIWSLGCSTDVYLNPNFRLNSTFPNIFSAFVWISFSRGSSKQSVDCWRARWPSNGLRAASMPGPGSEAGSSLHLRRPSGKSARSSWAWPRSLPSHLYRERATDCALHGMICSSKLASSRPRPRISMKSKWRRAMSQIGWSSWSMEHQSRPTRWSGGVPWLGQLAFLKRSPNLASTRSLWTRSPPSATGRSRSRTKRRWWRWSSEPGSLRLLHRA